VTQTQCQLCHSTDYIVMQPPGDAKQWEGVVTKMIKVFGAPLSEADREDHHGVPGPVPMVRLVSQS
jgi:hypothetical protein